MGDFPAQAIYLHALQKRRQTCRVLALDLSHNPFLHSFVKAINSLKLSIFLPCIEIYVSKKRLSVRNSLIRRINLL